MIVSQDKLVQICDVLKEENKKVVFTNGCFDIIHAGHVSYLYKAKSYGELLVVGLNSDNSVKRLKGELRPINSQSDRAIVLSALAMVDFVTIFNEDTPYKLIKLLMPDVLVKGGDYIKETVVGADIVEANGGKVILVPLLEGRSTSNIIEKMKNK